MRDVLSIAGGRKEGWVYGFGLNRLDLVLADIDWSGPWTYVPASARACVRDIVHRFQATGPSSTLACVLDSWLRLWPPSTFLSHLVLVSLFDPQSSLGIRCPTSIAMSHYHRNGRTSPHNRARSGCSTRKGILGAEVVVHPNPVTVRPKHPSHCSTALIILSKARRRLMEQPGSISLSLPPSSSRPAHLVQQHLVYLDPTASTDNLTPPLSRRLRRTPGWDSEVCLRSREEGLKGVWIEQAIEFLNPRHPSPPSHCLLNRVAIYLHLQAPGSSRRSASQISPACSGLVIVSNLGPTWPRSNLRS
ncbi:hypothetical protein DFP72DRAFT_461266 [Ephemerocybe angulata]|uniref:Uncharacterized protein n=1 Tax=Ephemerocybe angulata TaxID=980116 RepID=A0A8H6HSG2_9AGAR|nr:hypothetical protein DFP72DRAFT_461266 [Tulosesus angulatus]